MTQEECLAAITVIFWTIVYQGVGWFISIVEKIFEAVMEGLTVENCCVQLKVVNQLCENPNKGENYPEVIEKCVNCIIVVRHLFCHKLLGWISSYILCWKSHNLVQSSSFTQQDILLFTLW